MWWFEAACVLPTNAKQQQTNNHFVGIECVCCFFTYKDTYTHVSRQVLLGIHLLGCIISTRTRSEFQGVVQLTMALQSSACPLAFYLELCFSVRKRPERQPCRHVEQTPQKPLNLKSALRHDDRPQTRLTGLTCVVP